MNRLLSLVAVFAVGAVFALVIAPLALSGYDKNKPTMSDSCPNSSYVLYTVTGPSDPAQPADVNGDDVVCTKTVAENSQSGVSGPQNIDNTAHNQNG